MSQYVQQINQAEYEQAVEKAEGPVVLDFFSEECPPCEALAPKYEAVAEQFHGRVRFLKVMRQANRELAARLGVTGSPTLIFFDHGREVGERLTGEIQRSALKKAVESLVS